jgi:hypothetical protein
MEARSISRRVEDFGIAPGRPPLEESDDRCGMFQQLYSFVLTITRP